MDIRIVRLEEPDRDVCGMTHLERLRAAARAARDDSDRVLIIPGDRVFHRDLPKVVARAKGAVMGWGGVICADRASAAAILRGDPVAVTEVEPPWRGFSVPVGDPRAESLLLESLRKPADGLASRYLNRHLSLLVTRLLMRTRIHPNHVSVLTLACGIAAGLLVGLGHAIAGVLVLEVGSILDGIDGELARLRYQFSKRGEWLDTCSDDLSNVAFIAGATAALAAAGARWALPLGLSTLAAFAFTQAVQYLRLIREGTSGDIATFAWDVLAAGPLSRVTRFLSLLVKRDFFVTLFVPLVVLGRLDAVLALSAAGAHAVFLVLIVQLVRGRQSAAKQSPATQSAG